MKTRIILVLAIAASAPLLTLVACNGDNTQTQDGGPQNTPDAAKDVAHQNDTGTGNDAGPDAPNACSTGLVFDNTKVPGWPTNVPQP